MMLSRFTGRGILWEKFKKNLHAVFREAFTIIYHIGVLALSAGMALSLPVMAGFFATDFPQYWFIIEHDQVALITLEIAVAIMFIACLNYLRRSIEDRKLADMAEDAGFVYFFPIRRAFTQRKIRRLKTKHGRARTVMIIGSTGDRTFVDPKGDLRDVLENCLEAKIMLLDPRSESARCRARAILDPDITTEAFYEQVRRAIEFLRQLKAMQKFVKLKLYSDPPHVKLAILGDHIWLQHYHASRDVHAMPEYAFQHMHNDHGLYTMFYQYFIKRWESPEIPEYDFETDELVYASSSGVVIRREPFKAERRSRPDHDDVETVEA